MPLIRLLLMRGTMQLFAESAVQAVVGRLVGNRVEADDLPLLSLLKIIMNPPA